VKGIIDRLVVKIEVLLIEKIYSKMIGNQKGGDESGSLGL
jgi:hypothetical protein